MAVLAPFAVDGALAAAGTETYTYDVLGRLTQVTYPNGTYMQYSYDMAGNRTASGPTPLPPPHPYGTFTYVSNAGSYHTGSSSTLTVNLKNTGTGSITGISFTCSGSFRPGGATATLAPGAQAAYQCNSSSSSTAVTFTFMGTNATNSPFQYSFT